MEVDLTFRQRLAPGDRSVRSGFSLIELVVVLAVAGALIGIAVPSLSAYMARRGVLNASDAFVFSAARARAAAVERGDLVRLVVDPESDRIEVLVRVDSVLRSVDLSSGDTRADILINEDVGADGRLEVLFTPRGFADPGQGDGNLLPVTVGFASGDRVVWTRMSVVGRVERD